MDTTNILFICGGTFVGIDKIIAKRLGKRTIGFGQQSGMRGDADIAELLPQVDADDVLQFGLIPELVGRLPVISALKPLDTAALVRVLTEPKNALIKQYQKLFAMEGADLQFTDDGLRAIAKRAQQKDTGARGLRSIIEETMLDIMFHTCRNTQAASYVIDEPVVLGKKAAFPIVEAKTKSAGPFCIRSVRVRRLTLRDKCEYRGVSRFKPTPENVRGEVK